jgi:integrase
LANPFGTLAERYLSDLRSYPQPPAESTSYELSRKLRRLEALFLTWEAAEVIASADPRLIDVAAIKTFPDHMESRGFTNAYRAKLKQALAKLLTYAGNMVLEKLEDSGMIHISDTPPEIHPKSLGWLHESIAKLETLSDELPQGWPVRVVRFCLPMYFWTMLRVPELRKAKFADLDVRTWTMKVSVPKGLGRWAAHNSRIEIVPELRPQVSDFLDSRKLMLEYAGLSHCEPLVPTMFGTYYSGTAWSQMRCRIFRKTGIQTDRGDGFRILRPSGASFAKDEFDLDLETSQALLRHTNPGTTAKFYARMKAAKAWNRYSRALEARRKVNEDLPATS